MQTSLLGLGIALILALVAALIGPYFVNWNDHRAFFEAEASRLVGLPVRVSGPIAVSVLPTPSVRLGGIELGASSEASRLRARSLGIELALGALMRGELRAAEMRLVQPELNIGLNSAGQIDWPATTIAAETLSIDKLHIEDGRAVLTDAASGSRLVLDKLWFAGDVRSLIGPVRGEGAFVTAGALYGYRISAGRLGDEGLRLRLSLDTAEQPMSIEAEGMLAVERGAPRFDGTLAVARPAGSVLASGQAVANEPWRVSGKVKASSASALVEQLEYQYGPEERAVKLTGAAELKLGERPRLQGALSARQIDLDRLIATPEAPRRLPLAAIQSFAETFGAALRPGLPVNLAISVDAVTLGGATLQSVGTDLRAGGEGWHVDKLEFRAPGFTQVRLSGRLDAAQRLGFAGAVSVDANDPKTLVAWLAGRPGTGAQVKPWHVRGEVALTPDRIAVERLRTEFERGLIEGRLAYIWPAGDRPARLDAELTAGELDVDALLAFGESALSGMGLEPPREISLAFQAGRARIAGFEARNVTARGKLDGGGIAIERLSVADFGNASIEASGRIDIGSSPGGNITVDLDARELAAVIALAEKFTPLAEPLRQLAAGQNNAKLRAGVSLERAGAGNAIAKLNVSGRVGALRIELAAATSGKSDTIAATDWRTLRASDLRLDGRIESDDGNALLALLGLERAASPVRRPAGLSVAASGPLGGAVQVDARLAAGLIDATAKGALRLPADQPATLSLEQLSGSVGASKLQGRAAVTFSSPLRIDGALEADSIDAAAVIAAAVGMPPPRAGRSGPAAAWPADPFVPGAADWSGRIDIKAQQAAFSPALVARQFRAVAQLAPSQLTFEEVEGEFAGGRFGGRLALAASPDGISARARIALSGVDAPSLVPVAGRHPVTGRVTLQIEVEGAGRSPSAFVGSLAGNGTLTLADGQFASLNPRAFDAVMRAVDLGISPDTNRIRDFVTTALDNGNLAVPQAEAVLTIAGGQMRVTNVAARANGADLALAANLGLAEGVLDATLTLTGTPMVGDGIRPAVVVALKGPLTAPRRTVDANALTGWLALRAVEQQSKRIEAMEQSRREAEQAEAQEQARREAEQLRREAERAAEAARAASVPDAQALAPGALQPPAPPASSTPTHGISATDVPPLPPPIRIAPAPRARSAPRVEPRVETTTPPAPQPSTPLNLDAHRPLDLLGSQH